MNNSCFEVVRKYWMVATEIMFDIDFAQVFFFFDGESRDPVF